LADSILAEPGKGAIDCDQRRADNAEALLASYETLEVIAFDNDIHKLSENIGEFELQRNFVAAQECRHKRDKCDHSRFLDATQKMHELRELAGNTSILLLNRLYAVLDAELGKYAFQREESLRQLGIALFTERRAETFDRIAVEPGGKLHLVSKATHDWYLVSDEETQARYIPRNVVGHLLGMFQNGVGGYTSSETKQQRALATLTYLATNRDCPSFSWV
jgi:hypothetical protein